MSVQDRHIVSGVINAVVTGSINAITSISGQTVNVNTSISGNFVNTSVSGNVLNVNTSISGNIISIVSQTLGAPIVLTNSITLTNTGTVLPDQPVSSGVRFSMNIGQLNSSFAIGGGSGQILASYTDDSNHIGLFYHRENGVLSITDVIPVTNLNQLSLAGVNGFKVNYFAVHISG